MDTEFDRTDDDAEQEDDENSEDMRTPHNVRSAEINVDAFWQNPFALSMVTSNAVALRANPVKTNSADESADQDADGDDNREAINGAGDATATGGAGSPSNKRRKYGSHLCPVCSRSFGQKMVMYEHLNLHYGVRPHFCAVCGIRFASCSNLIKHRQLHRKHFSCVLCGERSPTFVSFVDVQTHVLTTHPEVFAYQCTVCHSKFDTQGQLADHVVVHPPLVIETRLEGKGKRKRNKPLVQQGTTSTIKHPGAGAGPVPLLRSRLRRGPRAGSSRTLNGASTEPLAMKNGIDATKSRTSIISTTTTSNGNFSQAVIKLPRSTPPHPAGINRVTMVSSEFPSKLDDATNGSCISPAPRLEGHNSVAINGNMCNQWESISGDRSLDRTSCSISAPVTAEENRLFETLLQRRILSGDLFRCSTCEILFFDRAMFSVHRCMHEENNPLRCAMCRTLCSDRYEFALHCVKPKQQDSAKLD